MRDRETLELFRRDLSHTDDSDLCVAIDKLLAGDESVRESVESACDQIDADLRKYGDA